MQYDEEPESLGLLALLLGYYDHALAHFEAHLLRQNSGYRVPLMCAHVRVGGALLGLGDQTRARAHLFGALRVAAEIGASQVLLEALLGIAQLAIVPPTLAVKLLTLVCVHPASNRYSRTQARYVLSTGEFSPIPDDPEETFADDGALTLEAAVACIAPLDPGMETAQQRANRQLVEPLSQRELEVLTLMAAGRTNQEIANELYIGVSTVKKHINRIFSKLNVTHRAQAVAHARSLNILP